MTARKKTYALAGVGLALLLIVAAAAYYNYMTSSGRVVRDPSNLQGSSKITADFSILSQARTDVCAYIGNQQANTNYIDSLASDYYLQGSCCTPMDYNHYVSQIESLKNYSSISLLPQDPYNVTASMAKQMISYDSLALTPAQQAVYDSAIKTSSKGPCCCQCWAWYAHEGLAKALISQYGWNVQQIANIWDLEDCCGGP